MSVCTVIQDVPRPQISMPNQSKHQSTFDEDEPKRNAKREATAESRPQAPKQEKAATAGWFGGIWSKLALRPKNQMKLPDDKNPTVSELMDCYELGMYKVYKNV